MNTLVAGEPRKHLITVDEYYRMAEVGLLAPDARVELIEGEIIDMAPIGPGHGGVVDYLSEQFIRAVQGKAIVRTQGAILLDRRSMPQPDLALLAPSKDYYRRKHPAPADILLVIEVSDTTLRYDRNRKLPLYARHGIPEAWIVDLQQNEVHFFRSPRDGQYLDLDSVREPAMTPIVASRGVEVDLSKLLVA
jgi:Uma2 family endonuclease